MSGSPAPRGRDADAARYLYTSILITLKELEHLQVQISRLNWVRLSMSDATQRKHIGMVIEDLMSLGEGKFLKIGLDLARSELNAAIPDVCERRVATALNSGASIATTAEGLRDLADKGPAERKSLTFDNLSRYRDALMAIDLFIHREKLYMAASNDEDPSEPLLV